MSSETELKNTHGENVSWFCLEGSVSLPELQDDKHTLPSDFEVMGENENGEEGSCQIDIVKLLESAHVVIDEKDSKIATLEESEKELIDMLNKLYPAVRSSYKQCAVENIPWVEYEALLAKHKRSE